MAPAADPTALTPLKRRSRGSSAARVPRMRRRELSSNYRSGRRQFMLRPRRH